MSATYDLTQGSRPWEVEFLWSNEPADTKPHTAFVSARWYEEALRVAELLLNFGPAIGKNRHPIFVHARPRAVGEADATDEAVKGSHADDGSNYVADVA